MKTSTKNLPAVTKPEVITPEVVAPLDNIDEPDYNTPGERIRYHVGMAQHHGRLALAHLILAGWELSKQKQAIGYGGWVEWCDKNLQISRHTADRYIQFYQKTVGEARNAAAIPLAKKPTIKELSAATVGMEQKSATRAMIDLGVIKRPKDWGGEREGAGRKSKGDAEVAAELKAVAENESVIWASAKGSLDNLVQLNAKRDMFHRLSGDHLATVAELLADLAGAAAKALEKRLGAVGTPALPTNC